MRNLDAPPWDLGPTVTLYHGTGTGALATILYEGLRPVTYSDLIEELMDDFRLWRAPEEIQESALKALRLGAGVEGRDPNRARIFLTPDFGEASRYAQSTYLGGELKLDLYRALRHWAKETGWPKKSSLPGGTPVVVELEIPWEYLITWQGAARERVEQLLVKAEEEWHHQGYASRENYLDQHGFEWMSEVPIPPDMIVEVHSVADYRP